MKHNDINNLDAFNYKVAPAIMQVPDPMNPGEYCNDKHFNRVPLVRLGSKGVSSTVVGIHSDKYKSQSTLEILQSYNKSLSENLNCKNVEIEDSVFDGGRKARRSIIFNDYRFDIGDKKESVALKLDLFNSYDGSWPFFSAFGAINFVCMNGLVSGQFAMVIIKKHTTGFRINAEISKMQNAATMFKKDIATFMRWTSKHVSWLDVESMLKDTIAKKSQSVRARALQKDEKESFSEPVLEYVMRESARLTGAGFSKNRDAKNQPSVWDVYNAATHWSSHGKELRLKKVDPTKRDSELDYEISDNLRAGASKHNVTRDRELKVAQMLISQSWQQLAA
jgi:hypothetical protein